MSVRVIADVPVNADRPEAGRQRKFYHLREGDALRLLDEDSELGGGPLLVLSVESDVSLSGDVTLRLTVRGNPRRH